MKKLVISGSSKLHERALYWRGYFEGRGYEVIDWPAPVSLEAETLDEPQTAPGLSLGRWLNSSDSDYAERLTNVYKRFYKNIDQADAFFLMNEDQKNIEGYIGASSFSELMYAIINNLNRGRKVDIYILKMPAKEQSCYEEVKFWIDQKIVRLYHRPTGKKALVPISKPTATEAPAEPIPDQDSQTPDAQTTPESTQPSTITAAPIESTSTCHVGFLRRSNDKTFDIATCKKKPLRPLSLEAREYLKILCPEFPAWLLKYIAAPEVQRLNGVGMACGIEYSSLFNFSAFTSVFAHSIGTALIVWNFTHDKRQTIAALLHDVANPAFKHSIDYLNGDSEVQTSTEARTGQIIRDSRAIMRQLKKDGILASEVSDYHLYPIADNELPNLAADRLEYTFCNGLFYYNTWTLDQVKTFYNDLTVLKNEDNLDELGFKTPEIAADFTQKSLPLLAIFHSEKARATQQFLADIIQSMVNGGYLSLDDLYVMSEREIIDWILSCGDQTIGDAFRQFQRTTTAYGSSTAKKNTYYTSVKSKVRYIVPLTQSEELDDTTGQPLTKRITEINDAVSNAVEEYLDEKQPKYVGFDFDFKPYTE